MSTPVSEFTIQIDRLDGFAFRTRFDRPGFADLLTDEPPPLGNDSAPNPARLLAASVGNCLAASLLFCLSKAKIAPQSLGAEVKVELVRNERKRLRVGKVEVTLRPGVAAEHEAFLECLEMFEDFCVVTESVREGLDVRVDVVAARSIE
jgi:organic hydroperoxide reductase OsmC/OhrA